MVLVTRTNKIFLATNSRFVAEQHLSTPRCSDVVMGLEIDFKHDYKRASPDELLLIGNSKSNTGVLDKFRTESTKWPSMENLNGKGSGKHGKI